MQGRKIQQKPNPIQEHILPQVAQAQAWRRGGGIQDIRKCMGICNDRDKLLWPLKWSKFSMVEGETPQRISTTYMYIVAVVALDQHKGYKRPLFTGTICLCWIAWQILLFIMVTKNSYTFPYNLEYPHPSPQAWAACHTPGIFWGII